MDAQKQTLRICILVLIGASLIRLSSGGFFTPILELLERPGVASFLVYIHTGRSVRMLPSQDISDPPPVTQPPETVPMPVISLPDFTAEDLSLIQVDYGCSYRPDLAALLTRQTDIDLSGSEPAVLIIHTHTTEAYTPTEGTRYDQTSPYRTLDARCNMIRVGEALAQSLENAGIGVIHDKAFHDYPSYNGSYDHAAQSLQSILEQNPSIKLVLDLHRDAADTDYGQLATYCTVDGKTSAQLMLIVGTDAGGLNHPGWQENLSLALKLQVILEKNTPGICRELNLTYQRYNQHLSPGALLIEVGAAGNTLEEALVAGEVLAEALIDLSGLS